MKRTTQTTIAAIMHFVMSLLGIVMGIPFLMQGAATVNQAGDKPPYFIFILGFMLSCIGLVSAWGVWKNQKWGKILTIVINAVNILSALPGVLIAPAPALRVFAITGIALCTLVIVLLLWRAPQRVAAVEA